MDTDILQVKLHRNANGNITGMSSDSGNTEIDLFLSLYSTFKNVTISASKAGGNTESDFKIKMLEEKLQLQKEYSNREISSLNSQLSEWKVIRQTQSAQSTNMAKGAIGENYVFNHLLDTYISEDYSVAKCSSKKEVGDIQFKYRDYSVCIESKNYVGSVRRAPQEKFIRDVNNSRYDAGIIYNMNSTFVDKPHFHIEYTAQNKPIIFISKLKDHPVYIDISIKIILFILRNTKPTEKKIDVSFIINEIRLLITDNRDLQNTINKSSDRLLRLIDQLTSS